MKTGTLLLTIPALLVVPLSGARGQDQPPEAYPAPPTYQPNTPPPAPAGDRQPSAYPAPPIPMRRPPNRVTQRFAVYGELLGKGFLYGVGADVNFTKWFGIGTLFSYVRLPNDELSAGLFAPYLALYAGGFSSAFVGHIGPLVLFGRRGDVWAFDRAVVGQASVGYEHRSGFLFRVMATFFFNDEDFIPLWPGFTFGGAF